MSDLSDEIMIPPKKRGKNDSKENEDRLSDLPECVLLHILSFLDAKPAVQTCILSTRWKHLWKRIPTLILNSSKFPSLKHFRKFVSQILTLRDSSTALHTLDLHRYGIIEPQLLKKILNYVSSHNTHIQQLAISVTGDSHLIMSCVSSCQALTSLKLSVSYILFPKSLNLPLLSNLDLTSIVFCGGENNCAEPFSAFTKLNSLVIHSCGIKDAQILSISSETLVNLALRSNYSFDFAKIELSTPSLCTFTFFSSLDQKICGSGLSSIKKVNIDAPQLSRVSVLFSWLLDLASIESLTITSTTLQIISLVPDVLEVKLTSLCNLKSLEVKLTPPDPVLSYRMEKAMLKKAAAKSRKEGAVLRKAFKAGLKPPPIPDGIIDFLRQNSPSAEVNITSEDTYHLNLKQVKESIKGMKNTNCRLFAVPGSSPAAPVSAAESASAAVPASAAPPNLYLCYAEKMVTNVDDSDSKLWPEFVTKAFIDIMVDEVTKGNMSNGVFHTRTWTLMTTKLNSITKSSYKEEQLKAKMDCLGAMFREFYSLLQNTEFGWNAETSTVTASEEVWQNYASIISCWKSYSTKIIQLEYFIIHPLKTHQIQIMKMSLMMKKLTLGMLVMNMLIRIIQITVYKM